MRLFFQSCDSGRVCTVHLCCILQEKCHTLFNKAYWKEAFIFNITLVPYLLSTSILNQADRIMINSMVGAAEAAIYSVAYSVAMLMQLLNNAVSDAFIPWMYRRLKAKEYKVIEPVTNKLLILVAGTNILLILFAPEVIAILRQQDTQMQYGLFHRSLLACLYVFVSKIYQCRSLLWCNDKCQQYINFSRSP